MVTFTIASWDSVFLTIQYLAAHHAVQSFCAGFAAPKGRSGALRTEKLWEISNKHGYTTG